MTIQCSYRTVDCSACGSSLFTPVVDGRTLYADLQGLPVCDGCDAPPAIRRPALVEVIQPARSRPARPFAHLRAIA